MLAMLLLFIKLTLLKFCCAIFW